MLFFNYLEINFYITTKVRGFRITILISQAYNFIMEVYGN
ncbi:hypothetical protein A33Q_1192 [Indibacter alkaliphilus LW1]|uniref:Uncharacterized protein n=1 Tax=Indibacter alkaliphilus (strain CCUG 57479 / KCTC 22604 / LW1) TaxID=1189612 RepID=S2E8D0_INDAL|nr:hypothetical protein A33Q_1192 [Indibacter alkaliphilus LW1]